MPTEDQPVDSGHCTACRHPRLAGGSDTHPNEGPCLICKVRGTGRCPVGWNGNPPTQPQG